MYIRFKNIPENEISGVYDGDLGRIRDELGVSCYQATKIGDVYKIVLPSLCSGVLSDLQHFIDEAKANKIPVYLVIGDLAGIGTYGEPVVKNVMITSSTK